MLCTRVRCCVELACCVRQLNAVHLSWMLSNQTATKSHANNPPDSCFPYEALSTQLGFQNIELNLGCQHTIKFPPRLPRFYGRDTFAKPEPSRYGSIRTLLSPRWALDRCFLPVAWLLVSTSRELSMFHGGNKLAADNVSGLNRREQ